MIPAGVVAIDSENTEESSSVFKELHLDKGSFIVEGRDPIEHKEFLLSELFKGVLANQVKLEEELTSSEQDEEPAGISFKSTKL